MKKLAMLTTTLLIATTLFGCAKEENKQVNTNNTEQTSAVTDDSKNSTSKTVIIEHSRGVSEVPKNPSKIAVFDFSVLDTLDTLGVEVEMALPTESIPTYLSKYKDITVNGGGIKEPNIEELFNFEPEIIFMSNRQSDFYDELSKIAPTVFVDLDSATYMEDFTKNVMYLAEIFEKEDLAQTALEKINTRIDEVKAKAENTDEKALVILTNNGKISAYGSGSRFGMIFDTLGLKQADENIEVSTHGQEVSFEYIAEKNPDILYVVDRNAVVSGEGNAGDTLNNDLVKQTNASKLNKIIYLDTEIWYIVGGGLSSVPKMIDEVEQGLN